MCSNSMFPVSGAAQFIASGATIGLRPLISASGAYCSTDSPAPSSASGRNRFHSPRRRASALSSSMIGGRSQPASSERGAPVASDSWKCGSAG